MDPNDLVLKVTRQLAAAGLDEPRREAVDLVTALLGLDRLALHTRAGQVLSTEQINLVSRAAKRRANREPLAYITGQVWFMNRLFEVGPGVLVPRPDTEVLVETVLDSLKDFDQASLRLLDACTGCGCIGISLLLDLQDKGIQADLTLTEIDPVAAVYARQNILRYNLSGRVELARTDLFPFNADPFDIIVSNPPYIPSQAITGLMPEVSLHEPAAALDGGADGVGFYRRLVREAPAYLADAGWLVVEHGYDQQDILLDLFRLDGRYGDLVARRDYGGQPRVCGGRLRPRELE